MQTYFKHRLKIPLVIKQNHIKDHINDNYADAQSEIFQGRGVFMKLEHFHKHFANNTRKKKNPKGRIVEFFLLDALKTTF